MNIVQPISQSAIYQSRFCHRNRDKERFTRSLDRIRGFGFKHKVTDPRQYFGLPILPAIAKLNNAIGPSFSSRFERHAILA